MQFSILNRRREPPKRPAKMNITKKTSEDGLILRFCHQVLNFELEELAQIMSMTPDEVRKLYYGFRNKAKTPEFDKIFEVLNIDREILLYYAVNWRDNDGTISPDLPFPVKVLSNDGSVSKERIWFQNLWFEENFKDVENVSVMKIIDNSLSPYGFNRGDFVIASRLTEHVLFRTRNVYMVRERDNAIYPRIAELYIDPKDNVTTRLLINPIDKNDTIPFSPLPEGVAMIGRIVWKSGLI
ncbi:MAG: hypothetical protein IJU40_04690 [Desulfovibrionaceae bacterium]|nr:hypothetical protein [Desulfovibrionaceae bacterium]